MTVSTISVLAKDFLPSYQTFVNSSAPPMYRNVSVGFCRYSPYSAALWEVGKFGRFFQSRAFFARRRSSVTSERQSRMADPSIFRQNV